MSARSESLRKAVVIVAFLGSATWAAWFLLTLPVVGAADHGDYYRVGRAAGLVVNPPVLGPEARPLVRRTHRVARRARGAPVSASIVVRLARALPVFSTEAASFDVRQLGVVYLAGFAALVAWALRVGVKPPVVLLLTWVLLDPGYLEYLNSLYSEPPALVAVFGLVLAWLHWSTARGRETRVTTSRVRLLAAAAGLLALVSFGAFSRAPMAILPSLVLSLLFLQWMAAGRPSLGQGGTAMVVALSFAGALPPLYFTVGPGPRFVEINVYHAVFLGPASVSGDPARMLARLGVSEKYAPLAGKSYFDARPTPALIEEVSRVSAGRRVAAYVAEPSAMLRVARRLSSELVATSTTPDYETAGAFPRHATMLRFSGFRRALLAWLPFSAWLLLMLSVALAAASGMPRSRVRLRLPAVVILFLVAVSVTQAFVAVWGDGFFGIGRHLLVARFAFDCLCALLLYEAGAAAWALLERRDAARSERAASGKADPAVRA